MKLPAGDIFTLRPGSTAYASARIDFDHAVGLAYTRQKNHCAIYGDFIRSFNRDFDPADWHTLPFLPIETFKYFDVMTGDWQPERVFRSSGTTSSIRSRHLVRSLAGYQRHAIHLFENRFGPLQAFRIFALLPNYLEAGDSSLVSMVAGFMDHTGQSDGFYLHDFSQLAHDLRKASNQGSRILLIGVTFALLDFAAQFPNVLPENAIVLETGGMKGRGEELTRSDLHTFLSSKLGTGNICSEYGMTELMSQAYSDFSGKFLPPASMAISVREMNDPLSEVRPGKVGVVNIIDLANIDTCCFLATSDLGIKHENGLFEIVGRLDQSDIRGCHLLYLPD